MYINISIIIPVYKNFQLVNNLLSTLLPTIDENCEIIIVDDGPLDCKLEPNQLPSNIIYISNEINLGYASSVNKGVRIARGSIITTINSDICVEYGWLEQTRQSFATYPKLGLLGAKLLYPHNGTISHCGVFFSNIDYMYHAFSRNNKCPFVDNMMKVPAVTFAFASFLKSDWYKLGGLDENYYNSHEDIDFCLRVKYELKKDIYLNSNIIAYHITSASEEQRFIGSNEAAKHFINKWSHIHENQSKKIFELSKNMYCSHEGIWPSEAIMISIPTRTGRKFGKYYTIFKDLSDIKEIAYYEFDDLLDITPRHVQRNDINLLKVLPFSFLEIKWPIIYFVDSYINLIGNYYWQLKRKNKDDLIFDSSFNIISMKELVIKSI